jgi:hypothetical protein
MNASARIGPHRSAAAQETRVPTAQHNKCYCRLEI